MTPRIPWNALLNRLARCLALGVSIAASLLAAPARSGIPASGPELRPALRVVGLKEGLPSLTVYSFAKDQENLLWVGTQFGVARFRGQRWEPVAFPGKIQPSVVRTIFRGSEGALWIATDNVGLWRLQRGVWTHFGLEEGLLSNRVNAVWEGTLDGVPSQVLAGTTQGLARLRGNRFEPFEPGPGPLSNAWIWKIKDGPGGAPWVAARGCVASRHQGAWQALTAAQGLPAPDVNDLEWLPRQGGGHDLMASIWNKGLFKFDGARWTSVLQKPGTSSQYPTCLLRTPDPGGNGDILWMGTYDHGIAWLREGRWHRLDQEKGFPSGGIYALFPEGKPTLWIGTRNGGMVALDLQGWNGLDRSLGLPSNEATALLPTLDAQGRPEVWVGTSKGLAHWQAGRWTHHTLDAKAPDFINSIVETRVGRQRFLWVGTLRGLVRFDGRRWERLDPRRTTIDPQVFRLQAGTAPQREPVLWAGTQWGLASLRKGVWTVQTRSDGLPHDWIFDILETECRDGERDVWVATRGGGVGRYHRGRWENLRKGLEVGGDLVVTCLKEAKAPDGTRWLFAGTQGRGLMRLSLDHPELPWTVFQEETLPGLPAQGISAMELDDQGRLFLGTPKGILRLSLGPGGSLESPGLFGRADGLPSLSITLGSLALGPDGQIWVGTVEGIGVLSPQRHDALPPNAPPLVDWVDRWGHSQGWKDGLSLLHKENSLSLRLTLPLYHHFEEVQFRTQLLGLEKHPSPWSEEALRKYPVLPSGNQRMRVWARDHLGRESPPRDLLFRVEAPPWKRPWALLLYVLLGGGLVWAIFGLRVRLLTRRNRLLQEEIHTATSALESAKAELEDRVRERTQELGEALDHAKAADRAKSAFLARMSHELRTPLGQMMLMTQLAQGEWSEATGQAASPDLDIILQSGRTLETLISDLLDFSALEAGRFELGSEPFDLTALLGEIQGLYAPLAKAKGLEFKVADTRETPRALLGDRCRLGQVLKDLLSNAIKFTDQGSVTLRVRPGAEPGALRFEVDDTGPGLKTDIQQKIFEPFEQPDGDLARRHEGTGLGLAIAKRILAQMHGDIGFEALPTGGARFWVEITFPLAEGLKP